MSLKTFHILFVTVCTVGLLAFGIWSGRQYKAGGATGDLVWAIVGFAGTGVMLCYGRWFLKKLQKNNLS
jgi:hypothetical protein